MKRILNIILDELLVILGFVLACAFLLEPVLRLLGYPEAAIWVADKSLFVFVFFIGFLSFKNLVLVPKKETSKGDYKSRQYQRYNQRSGYRQRKPAREESYQDAEEETPMVASVDDVL